MLRKVEISNIEYLKTNGYAITRQGMDAMSRNGRKWTIGYKTEIDFGDKKAQFNFDAITDEGGGPSQYVLDQSSDKIFNKLSHGATGKLKWLKELKSILKDNS